MNLLTLARRNIRLNGRKYAMYMFSMGFSVFTVYTFLALMGNETVMTAFMYDSRYQSLLLSFGVIILVFVLFFLISSNNSFIRARKKELSTYALFGMANSRIGLLLFLETMIVGMATLAVGIGAGIFFSKLMAMMLLNIALTSFVGDVSFTTELYPIYLTAGLFFLIFCFMGLSGWRVVSKFQLVDLFKGGRMSEGRQKGSLLLLLLSVTLIAAGYITAFSSDVRIVVLGAIPILVLVISGTYLFFWGGLPKVLGMLKKNKHVFYRGANLISVSAVSHRMKSVASVMATISVLSAVAVTAMATGFTLYSNVERSTYADIGFDLAVYNADEAATAAISDIIRKHGAGIEQELVVSRYTVSPDIDPVMVGERTHLSSSSTIRVYSETEYNRLASASRSDLDSVQVTAGEAHYLYSYYEEGVDLAMLGQRISFGSEDIRVTEVGSSSVQSFGLTHTLILNDGQFQALIQGNLIPPPLDEVALYNYVGALSNRELNEELDSTLQQSGLSHRTAYYLYNESLETFGLICFIGFFMSGVFILMTASLLYFKQIMAAEEERHQYQMLRRIGMDSRTERQVVRRRLLPVFFIPLAMGILHSIFAMKTADITVFAHMIPVANSYLYVLGFSAVMYAVYAIVYGLFYLLTKSQYQRIVRN